MKDQSLSVKNLTTGKLPRLPFVKAKNRVLGKKYHLSLVLAGPALMRKHNRRYRNIDRPTDILSFSLSRDEGEMFICLSQAKRKAAAYGWNAGQYLPNLFIHGLMHLKGMRHGSKMENEEKKARVALRK